MRTRTVYEEIGRAIWARYRKYAGAQVARAIKEGQLPRPETLRCVYCGGRAICYDHRNYHLHLDVVPACDSCNHLQPPAHVDARTVLDHIEGRRKFYVCKPPNVTDEIRKKWDDITALLEK